MKSNIKQSDFTMWNKTTFLVLSILFILPIISIGQNESKKYMHHEIPDDSYVKVSRENMKRAPAYTFQSKNVFFTQVNIDEDGNDIVGDAANEPSIAVDPTNTDRIVIGWRQFDNINNNFRQAGYAYSLDGGITWTFDDVIDPGVFRSDPVLDFDTDGNFYYNSLTADNQNNFTCNVYKIEDGGVEWDDGEYAYGGDKQWMRIDKTDGIGSGNNYSFWTSWWSICYPGAFTRSTDAANSFEECVIVDGDPSWGTLAVGPDGELYIIGAGYDYDIVVTKSTTAQDPESSVTWDIYSGAYLGGYLDGWSPINPEGLIGQAWIDVDISNGPSRGYVYACASVVPYSGGDPADVMFARSTDGELGFTAPIRINDDESNDNYQWFGTMSVAPNGRIDVVWLDTRDDNPGPYFSALYYSYSVDAGETWSENEKLSDAFDPHVGWPQQQKMGDYFDMVSDNDGAHLAWSNTLNGGQDVYYAHITTIPSDIQSNTANAYLLKNYPNPFYEETTISYYLKNNETVNIEVLDLLGRKVKTLLNESMPAGKHAVSWNGCDDSENRLPEGIYFYRFTAGNAAETHKMLLKN